MLIMEIEPSLPTLSELPGLGQVDLKVRFSLGATKKVVMFVAVYLEPGTLFVGDEG
jgi:hypothetical protein